MRISGEETSRNLRAYRGRSPPRHMKKKKKDIIDIKPWQNYSSVISICKI